MVGKVDSLGFMRMIENKHSDPMSSHLLLGLPNGSAVSNVMYRSQNYPFSEVFEKGGKREETQGLMRNYKKFGDKTNK